MEKTNIQEESLFHQILAMDNLLTLMYTNKFLESEEYKSYSDDEKNNAREVCEHINSVLEKSGGIGNPATMLMMLYSILVLPKEIYKKNDKYSNFKNYLDRTVSEFCNNNKKECTSKYTAEVGFADHIRNALSHGRVEFHEQYVIFSDEIPNTIQKFQIRFKTMEIGSLVCELVKLLNKFLNRNFYMNKQ